MIRARLEEGGSVGMTFLRKLFTAVTRGLVLALGL